MKRFVAWLERPLPFKKWIPFIGLCVAIGFAWDIVAFILFNLLHIQLPERPDLRRVPFFDLVIIGPFIEEIIFRVMPIVIYLVSARVGRVQNKNVHNGLLFIVVIAASVVFGFAHGGWQFIFVQGVSGVVWSIIFLKCGGVRMKIGLALFGSFSAHAAHNLICFFLQ